MMKQSLFDTFQPKHNVYTSIVTSPSSIRPTKDRAYDGETIVFEPIQTSARKIIIQYVMWDNTTISESYTESTTIDVDSVKTIDVSTTVDVSITEPISVSVTFNGNYKRLFQTIKNRHTDMDIPVDGLDDLYFYNRSKFRMIAPSVEMWCKMHGTELETPNGIIKAISDDDIDKLADRIYSVYGLGWNRIYNALIKDYEPLENYDMTQVETPDITHKQSVSDDYSLTDTTNTKTKMTSQTNDMTSDAKVYGFNSSSGVNASQNVVNGSVVTSGNANENEQKNERTQTGYTEDNESGTRTLTRHGNIGVTTSQQMLQSEVDIRVKTQMWNIMMNDVDNIITLKSFTDGYTDILLYD